MSAKTELIAGERAAIASYLRRLARNSRDHADRLLADTTQAAQEAAWRACANALGQAASDIDEGRHWR